MVLKSILLLSLANDVTSSDKNIVIIWLKHICNLKFFAQHNIGSLTKPRNCKKTNFSGEAKN